MTSVANYTTLAAWPLAICRALEARNVAPDPLLAAAGLNREEFVSNPDGRVDVRQMTRFWDQVLAETGDEAFGLVVARHVQPMHFRALGMLMHTTGSLEQAVLKLAQYSALVSNSARIRLESTPVSLGFCIDPIPDVRISAMAVDSFLATLTRLIGQLGASQPFVDKVELMRNHPKDPGIWTEAFHANVVFGASQNGVWFNRLQLKRGALMGDPQLSAFNESMVQTYVGALQKAPYSHRVKQLIMTQLGSREPGLIAIAATLNMNERSLRRHLKDEGTTYRELLHQCRMELAERYLSHSQLSITDISLRVGFTDTSNFSRAFTRAFGRSPSDFRKEIRSA